MVDLWLAPGVENIGRACVALTKFGVPPEIARALRDATPDDIVWLGRPPTRIDLLQSLPAADFEEAWPRTRRLVVELNGVSVPVLGKDDLIRNKQAVGRPQDRRDERLLLGQALGLVELHANAAERDALSSVSRSTASFAASVGFPVHAVVSVDVRGRSWTFVDAG